MSTHPDEIPRMVEKDDTDYELSGLAVGVEERLKHYNQAKRYKEEGAIADFVIKRFEDVEMKQFHGVDSKRKPTKTVFGFYFTYPAMRRRGGIAEYT